MKLNLKIWQIITSTILSIVVLVGLPIFYIINFADSSIVKASNIIYSNIYIPREYKKAINTVILNKNLLNIIEFNNIKNSLSNEFKKEVMKNLPELSAKNPTKEQKEAYTHDLIIASGGLMRGLIKTKIQNKNLQYSINNEVEDLLTFSWTVYSRTRDLERQTGKVLLNGKFQKIKNFFLIKENERILLSVIWNTWKNEFADDKYLAYEFEFSFFMILDIQTMLFSS